ncbi:aminodeoxychorismate synthase, component I [Halospeciosus flavus]|uniref:anthranilate synthase n=1 Tax=Halospeciosus flavus TaxID=3032283 RepID=A0ABD5Z544_9EURY|nr:aminodeoxychorismate synthase, component I [Halospeciosus flavus]
MVTDAARLVTSRDTFREVARDADGAGEGTVRVPVEVHLPVDDPYEAFRRARGDEPAFFFETGGVTADDEDDESRGRPLEDADWGYFGVAPSELSEVADAGAFDTLDGLETDTLAQGSCPVPFPGGHVGWLSYDAVRELETLPDSATADRDLPMLQVATYDRLVAWREPFEAGDPLYVVAAPRVDDPDAAFERGRDRALALAARVTEGDPDVGDAPAPGADPTFESDCGRADFREKVETIQEHVRAGDTFQANVSHRLVAPAAVHPVNLYAALREVNPAPYASLVEFPGVDLVSASPELLLEREGERVRTEPIAGTRPRGDTEAEDERLEADLRENEKERAEHAMLVDLERNDLGKVSEYGSVDVAEYRRVDRYSEVMHLVSDVEGRLREGTSLGDSVAAMFPGGTITGAPKPKTMELVDRVEDTRRGPYTGSAFIAGFDGRATFNILIRTLVRHADEYHLRVGAGIVADSDPDAEYDETLDKARGMVNALDAAVEADLEVEGE